jgi:hypothetical protein
MTPPIVHPLDVSFVLAVTFAGLVWAPAALAVAAGYFALNAYLQRKAE